MSHINNDFAHAAEQSSAGMLAEFWAFLRHHRSWWMVPILVTLLAFGVLVMASGSAAAPFIYTLF